MPSIHSNTTFFKRLTNEEITKKLKDTPLGRLATPLDTAKLCLFLLSEDASFITGENIWINGGRF